MAAYTEEYFLFNFMSPVGGGWSSHSMRVKSFCVSTSGLLDGAGNELFLISLAGKRSKILPKESLILIPSIIIAVFRVCRRLWQPESWAKLWISLNIMLVDAMVIRCAAVVSKLVLFLLLSELLRQSLLCEIQKGLGYCGPEVLNLKI